MDPLFERRELKRNVHIHSKFLQKNMLQPLLSQLRTNLEGHCSSEGFIQSQSITILQYSIGRTNYIQGGLDYEVTFQADVCLPHPGQVFKATVDLRSKIGIHAKLDPLKILIPRDLHIGNEEFDSVEVEKEIEFEVINCQFKQMDKDIIIIGKLRSQLKAAPLMPLFHAEQEIEIKPMSLGENPDEKLVVVTAAPAEPKKKRLKRKAVEISNEPPQIGND
jgi:DNA-directed RNA polymerase subunit E'/Rpb7